MFRKLIIASAILAATSTVALASSGPYIGGSVGVNSSTFTDTDNVATKASTDFGGRGAIGNLFAGYGAMVNSNIYLGGEAFADLTNTSAEFKIPGLKKTISQKYGYGISFIPGVMLSDHTMAYGRIGVIRSRFELATDVQDRSSTTKRQALTGGQIGLGLQTSLTQNLDLRGEYDYTRYREAKFNDTNSIQPRSDSFNLGLVYKFD